MAFEFIITLIQHRKLGYIFAPYLMYKNGPFYTLHALVKKQGLGSYGYGFTTQEIELVNIIEQYSDENLARRFSKTPHVTDFYKQLKPDFFKKNVLPFIEKQMSKCVLILMDSPVRLFKKEAKYANLYEEDLLVVNQHFAEPEFHFTKMVEGTKYSLNIVQDDYQFTLWNKQVVVVNSNPAILLHHNRLVVFEKLSAKKLLPFFTKEFVTIPKSIEDKYYQSFILSTIRENKVVADGFRIKKDKSFKKAVLALKMGKANEPFFSLKFNYGGEYIHPKSSLNLVVKLEKNDGAYLFKKFERDPKWEDSQLLILKNQGLVEKNGAWLPKGYLGDEKKQALYALVNWLNKNSPELLAHGFDIQQKNIEKNYYTGRQKLELELQTQKDWFDVYATVTFGEFKIPFVQLKRYILGGDREFQLPDGTYAVLPEEWFAQFSDLMPYSKVEGENLKFKKHHFSLLQNQLQGIPHGLIQKLQDFQLDSKQKTTLPENMEVKLRNYQEQGFKWLMHLNKNGFGGCLADDMGLGKTLQTLALLLKTRGAKPEMTSAFENGQQGLFDKEFEKGQYQPASLIILPTSLVHNWENEIKKFTPGLRVFKYVGIKRKKDVNLTKIAAYFDVILTTYGTVRNDVKVLSELNFHYIIIDESQYIKNSASKTYKAVMSLRSSHRLSLTGTPIENSLLDLWSQFNFLNKGLLGNLAYFKKHFMTPIEKHNDQEKKEKLQVLIRPFVLRRTKMEVAKELPPLMEQVRYCTMEKDQSSKYEQEKSVIRNSILENIEKEGVKKSSFVLLQGLTRLRQLANHPQLLDKKDFFSSGKYNEIFISLTNILAENHKVLIFSSFVQHLKLIEKGLVEQGWGYSKLTGQTANREEVINQFQGDPGKKVFLISLKAGGVGLNLTEADYVFIIDPWWNPAAENQAVSRAHRIGQNKHVFVYRFITENSIEEKILQLQQQKSALADAFINSNNPFKEITKEEILSLLA